MGAPLMRKMAGNTVPPYGWVYEDASRPPATCSWCASPLVPHAAVAPHNDLIIHICPTCDGWGAWP